MPRTIYLLLGGFLLAMLFYEAQIWQAIFASAAFFTLVAVVEILAMLLIGLRIPDTDVLMQAGAARLIYVVFSNLIQIPLLILVSHFFSRKENVLAFFGYCRSSRFKLPASQFAMWYSTMQRMKIFQTT